MNKRLLTLAAVAAGAALLAKKLSQPRAGAGRPQRVKETIEVDLPVRSVYNQWTQFEDFPQFMESVHEVRQFDDKQLHWRADVFGKTVEWNADITEQIPDRKIAWRSTAGARNDGEVTFSALSPSRTRITLLLTYQPDGPLEALGDAMGAVRKEARSNLQRFKDNLERQGHASGAWRGTIHPDSGATQAH